jgi:hypothetical protein
MTVRKEGKPTRIILLTQVTRRAMSVFAPSAFSEELEPVGRACGRRLALVWTNAERLRRELDRDIERFHLQIQKTGVSRPETTVAAAHLAPIVQFDGLEGLDALHGFLAAVKTFLDVYAILMARLIASNSPRSFGKKTINGQQLSGGTIIYWLRRQGAAPTYEHRLDLAECIEMHSRDWITKAVGYRDQATHGLEIAGWLSLRVRHAESADQASFQQVEMPDGQPVMKYAEQVQSLLGAFVQQTLPLLPNVDIAKLDLAAAR